MAEPDREAQASAQDAAEDPEAAPVELDQEMLRALLDGARAERDRQKGEADEYLKLLQRTQADFLNYKRRIEAEQGSKAEAVRAETIRAFLPLADDLERALAHVPAQAAEESWVEGFRLIQRNLEAAFERLGVRRVGVVGDLFDPNLHEAVAYEEHPSQPEGHVAAVLRPGYQLGERVVRPAQVSVARAAQKPPRGGPSWRPHQARRAHGNGGADPGDAERPRGIVANEE
jgi:molecular chaperone GrpE